MNVMAPTMQVACKAFIVPNPAARSPKERYTHVPRSLRRVRHARCFSGQCPSEATNKIGMRHIYWSCCQNATATQGAGCTTRKKSSKSWLKAQRVRLCSMLALLRCEIQPCLCPLWVKSRHRAPLGLCPLYPQKRTNRRRSTCPLCAKSGRTRRSKISYSITARSEVERIALKIGASAGRALSHRQRLRGLSLIQRISSNLNGLCLRHVLSNGKSSRRTLRCSE